MTRPTPEQKSNSSTMTTTIKLISFDLDNALYDNQPVLRKAEQLSAEYLRQEFEKQSLEFKFENFLAIRRRMLGENNPLYENLSLFRRQALAQFCSGLTHCDDIVEQAFKLFINARSDAEIPQEIGETLEELAKEFILVSVTNGNCDPNKLSVGHLFSKNYSPQDGFRAKPHPQMLLTALDDFSLDQSALLHVGDSPEKDGAAAAAANVNFLHFAPFESNNTVTESTRALYQTLGLKNR